MCADEQPSSHNNDIIMGRCEGANLCPIHLHIYKLLLILGFTINLHLMAFMLQEQSKFLEFNG